MKFGFSDKCSNSFSPLLCVVGLPRFSADISMVGVCCLSFECFISGFRWVFLGGELTYACFLLTSSTFITGILWEGEGFISTFSVGVCCLFFECFISGFRWGFLGGERTSACFLLTSSTFITGILWEGEGFISTFSVGVCCLFFECFISGFRWGFLGGERTSACFLLTSSTFITGILLTGEGFISTFSRFFFSSFG